MKAKLIRNTGLLLSLTAALAVSCSKGGEKKPDANGDPPKTEIGKGEVTQERVQAFGFASRLPADTETVIGARHLDEVISGFLKSNFFQQITALAGGAVDPEMVAQGQAMVTNYIGKDVFIAFANGSSKELDSLMVILDAYNRFSYSMMMKGLMGGGAGLEALAAADDPVEMLRQALLGEDQALLKALEELDLPPMIIGARVTDGAQAVLDQLGALEGQLPPMFVAADFEVEGAGKFRSWSVAAKEAFGDAERAAMRDEIGDAELADRVEKLIDKKTVDFSFGLVGDYLLFAIGPNHDHVKLASKPEESLLSAKEFDFADQYLSKKIIGYSYATEGAYAAVNRPDSILAITDAVQDGLAEMAQNGLDLGEVSAAVGKAGKLMVDMSKRDASASMGVVYLEDGIKGESIGGFSTPGLDTSAKLIFADAIPENAFFAMDMVSTAKYEKQSLELLETIVEGAHAAAAKFATMDENFGEQFNAMDTLFRPKLLKIYDIMKNQVQAGLGRESGIVIDLEGKVPKLPIPGMPQAIVNQGKMPRIAMMANVEDRAKLSKGWDELVPALNDLFKVIPGQEAGAEFQLPDTMSSDANGLKTHFIGLAAFNEDLTPSVSISDDLFFLSTAKSLSESIAAKAKPGDKTGLILTLNFDALRVFGEDWLKLVVNNADEIFGGDQFRADDFRENAGMIQMVLNMMQAVNRLDVHNFKEGGHWRTSFHLKISDVPSGAN